MNKVIIISGPTATGKTKCAISVAEKFRAEVVNFDSLLFYKELSIGTAKPTSEEIKNIPNESVDFIFSDLPYSDKTIKRVTANKWDV